MHAVQVKAESGLVELIVWTPRNHHVPSSCLPWLLSYERIWPLLHCHRCQNGRRWHLTASPAIRDGRKRDRGWMDVATVNILNKCRRQKHNVLCCQEWNGAFSQWSTTVVNRRTFDWPLDIYTYVYILCRYISQHERIRKIRSEWSWDSCSIAIILTSQEWFLVSGLKVIRKSDTHGIFPVILCTSFFGGVWFGYILFWWTSVIQSSIFRLLECLVARQLSK